MFLFSAFIYVIYCSIRQFMTMIFNQKDTSFGKDKFEDLVGALSFPISKKIPKWVATCPSCKRSYRYQRIVKGAACRSCCNNFYGGKWDEKCLLTYKPFSAVK